MANTPTIFTSRQNGRNMQRTDSRPSNILFIFSDQHNPKFTGYEGHDFISTPNLDWLVQQGVCFTNAYTSNPICVPARYSMLSGLYCKDICVYDNGTVPAPDMPSFARHFSEAGWRTCLIGKAHFTGNDQFRGYQERPYGDFLGIGHQTDPYRGANPELEGTGGCGNHPVGGSFKLAGPSGIPEFLTAENIITHEAVKWLQVHRAAHQDKPFLLSVQYPKPHFPYQPPVRWFERYKECVKGRAHILTEEEIRGRLPVHQEHWKHYLGYGPAQDEMDRALAGYAGNVSYMDENIGRLLDSVKHLGYMDNTVIIYSSDHGEMAGAHGLWHKQMFYEESARIPLIFAGPGIGRSEKRHNVVSLIDIFPTLCALAGFPIPNHCAGKSLVPFLSMPGDLDNNRMIFSEIAWRPECQGAMARYGPWKYCWYIDGTDELYNLEKDPGEINNRVNDTNIADIRDKLQKSLLEFWQPGNLKQRLQALPKVLGKGEYAVAMQYCLPGGAWVDAWP